MRTGNIRSWGVAVVLGIAAAACGGGDDEDGGKDVSPEEACTALHDLCPGFPLPQDECVEAAESDAPQNELNCVGSAESCHEALVDCIGYSEETYESIVKASEMGGAGN